MKQLNKAAEGPPVAVEAQALYRRWVDALEHLQALRGSIGLDKRHLDMALEDINELYMHAHALSLKSDVDRSTMVFLNLILSRPVKEHQLLSQKRHHVV